MLALCRDCELCVTLQRPLRKLISALCEPIPPIAINNQTIGRKCVNERKEKLHLAREEAKAKEQVKVNAKVKAEAKAKPKPQSG